MTDTELYAKARDFAAKKHAGQLRKGANREPYITHPIEVAKLVSEATGGNDEILIAAAVLHDTIEDTDASYDDLFEEFNREVADLVAEVTDDTRLPGATRKASQIADMPKKSDRAKMIKMADKISNLRSIRDSPPASWTDEKKRNYIEFSSSVVNGARDANECLAMEFDRIEAELLEQLNGSKP
ncbi:MAG: HD domain-containing protein [Chloroflexota bacterium]